VSVEPKTIVEYARLGVPVVLGGAGMMLGWALLGEVPLMGRLVERCGEPGVLVMFLLGAALIHLALDRDLRLRRALIKILKRHKQQADNLPRIMTAVAALLESRNRTYGEIELVLEPVPYWLDIWRKIADGVELAARDMTERALTNPITDVQQEFARAIEEMQLKKSS